MRLAVVSSDGKNVDLHLGRGNSIYVYDYDGELTFVENRNLEIAEDSKHQGGKVIKACEDCDVLFCVQYGFKSKIKAEDANIKLVKRTKIWYNEKNMRKCNQNRHWYPIK